MLWIIVLFLIVVSVPAILISQNNRNALMDAMAMHERLQRTDSSDPLAQLGPTEFQRAYERAAKSRGKPMMIGIGLGLLIGLFLGFGIAFGVALMMSNADMLVPVYGLTLIGFPVVGAWIGASKRLSVYDQMRKQLQLD